MIVGAVVAIAASTYVLTFAAQAARPGERITVTLSPSAIVADGVSSSTATATLRFAGALLPGQALAFSSSDSGIRFDAGPSARSELRQTFSGTMLSLVTMQWTFHYTPAYTRVLSLAVNGVPTGARVLIACHGRGCPFTTHLTVTGQTVSCAPGRKGGCGCGENGQDRCGCGGDGQDGCGCRGDAQDGCGCGGDAQAGCGCGRDAQAGCQTGVTIALTRYFRQHRLGVGTRITVAISRPEWIGKYYTFKIRAGRGPTVQVACLAPGETQPGAAC